MISADLTSWRMQYDRMKRTYDRAMKEHKSSVAYEDHLTHFFQDCWHLKDWIRSDKYISPPISEIEEQVNARDTLVIVGDLANGGKHLVLNDRRKITKGAKVVRSNTTIVPGEGSTFEYIIRLDDGTFRDAREVAKEACEEWDRLLRKWGLI